MTYDWLLALHVVSAFLLSAALVLFTVLMIALRRTDEPGPTARIGRASTVGNVVIGVGGVGTLVFGIWLALDKDAYSIWDGWVIGALVLWLVAMAVGGVGGKEFERAFTRARELDSAGESGPNAELAALNRTQRGTVLHVISTALTFVVLLDMIFKPGA